MGSYNTSGDKVWDKPSSRNTEDPIVIYQIVASVTQVNGYRLKVKVAQQR